MIYIDMDGVLANLTEGILTRYNKEFNTDFKESDITYWDINECLDKRRDIFEYIQEEGFCSSLNPYPFAKEFVKSLKDNNLDYYFLSSAFDLPTGANDKATWLRDTLEDNPKKLITCDKLFKHVILKGGDIMLDDNPDIIERCKTKTEYAFLVKRTYNEGIMGLEDILEEILKINK